jgi:predicted 3-demethylubiquinone-9 3-methyltransferase (glyoxalase superfamily)
MTSITPFVWFDDDLGPAMDFYLSVFPDGKVLSSSSSPDGKLFTGIFTIAGQTVFGLNGGPGHPHTDAFSLYVDCADQAEVDRYWDALAVDGTPVACGWITDKFGLSWQIIPKRLNELLGDPDPARAQRAMAAMMGMVKLDVAALDAAADGA